MEVFKIELNKYEDIEKIAKEIGADKEACFWIAKKAKGFGVVIKGMKCFAANIIKQEMLSCGGDAIIHRECITGKVEHSDVCVIGEIGRIKAAMDKLHFQPGMLKEVSNNVINILDGEKDSLGKVFKCGKYTFPLGERTYIMGILNVTPDSFSDGGEAVEFEQAIDKAKMLIDQGADIIDIGGESTRPGYHKVDAATEKERVIKIVEYISSNFDIPVSIDTQKREVAVAALDAGACILNDINGMQGEDMSDLVASHSAGVVLMHNQDGTEYNSMMDDILNFLKNSVEICLKAGVPFANISIDPGIGFGKTTDQNLEVLNKMEMLKTLGVPILLGTSRKSVIGNTLGLPVDERVEGTAATVAIGIAKGADFVRVHDVKEMQRVVKMSDAIVRR